MSARVVIPPAGGAAIDPRTGYWMPVWLQFFEQLALAVGGDAGGDRIGDVGASSASTSSMVLSLANSAQSSANAANAAVASIGSGKPSGTSGPNLFDVSTGAWVTVASVNLVGIVAGSLRFDATDLRAGMATSMTGLSIGCAYRVTETSTSGGAVSVCFSDTWSAAFFGEPLDPVEVTFNASPLNVARPVTVNTGAVTYKLQVQKVSGSGVLTGALAIFRAAQA
jgi:hypothetical protein